MLVIPARYNGPRSSANGGYACGLVAHALGADGPVEVTLRRPPPLETPLAVSDEGVVTAPDGGVVASARPVAMPAVELPPPVPLADAEYAVERYAGFREHVFPTCFVCGPGRDDGLAIFPGEAAPGVVAAPWRVPADDDPALVWAALDCPGAWAGDISPGRPSVLGRLTVQVRARPAPGAATVVTGWAVELGERKMLAGTAVRSPDGEVYAVGLATWVRLSPEALAAFDG